MFRATVLHAVGGRVRIHAEISAYLAAQRYDNLVMTYRTPPVTSRASPTTALQA
ncbi:hypothetical protein ACIRRA_36550 [Nocardia sp. NPDC101769]|uniref:hypothetical protein n=1 Tax=Nocardia sp. NPDC101769 TaxID=3364333 RepID=UPI0038100088